MTYKLRHSARAKYLRIIIKPGVIEVVAPLKTTDKQIQSFVTSQQSWIQSTLIRVAEKAEAIPELAPSDYTDGVCIPFQGQKLPLLLKHHASKTTRIQLKADTHFIATLANDIPTEQRSEVIRQALIRWMKKQARQLTNELIEKHAPQLNLYPRSLKIKTLSSRWGSCGPHNDINMNWLLLLAPPQALEYVVIHELCHIKHKNHSPDFWNLIAKHFPDYQQQRNWLKQHGASLMKGL
ncbi:SprT family zinc-dependent metalloprotease [Methylomonas sp. AM2-LC]|uniref:M48 family metallopeptidase n=1 Tax=Methylomonas sp. AM2-LC TaxID=3153301 RepID=UPI003263017C